MVSPSPEQIPEQRGAVKTCLENLFLNMGQTVIAFAEMHYLLARILLAIYDPQLPRLGPSKVRAERKVDVRYNRLP